MKQANKTLGILLCCLSLLLLLTETVSAQNMQQIKARMLERKPTIDSLKSKGVIGAGNDGYLHFRQEAGGQAKQVVGAENADRKTVNAAIAQREGTTVEKVSKTVADRLRASAAPGQWVQKGDGTWVRK